MEEVASPQVNNPLAEINLNVDDLLTKQTTQVKVVIVNPGGRVDAHTQFDDKTKSMILNLCRKNWTTVANLSLQHPNVRQELEAPCEADEFKSYCGDATDSVLKKSSPDDLAGYSKN